MYLIIYLRRIRLHGLSACYDGRTDRRRPRSKKKKKNNNAGHLFFRTDKEDFRHHSHSARPNYRISQLDRKTKSGFAGELLSFAPGMLAARKREREREGREHVSRLFISSARGSAFNLARRGPSGMSPSRFIATVFCVCVCSPKCASNWVRSTSAFRSAFRELPLTERSSDGGLNSRLSPSFSSSAFATG